MNMRATLAMVALAFATMHSTASAQDPIEKASTEGSCAYALVSQVRGQTLQSTAGDDLGVIEELLLNRNGHEIAFAVLDVSSTSGDKGRTVAIPFSLVRCSGTPESMAFTSSATKEAVAKAPAFELAKLAEHLANPSWQRDERAAFGAYPEGLEVPRPSVPDVSTASAREGVKPCPCIASRDLIGSQVVATPNPGEATDPSSAVGRVQDLVCDSKNQKVSALVVLPAANPDPGCYVIPCGSLTSTSQGKELAVNKTLDEMNAAPRCPKDAMTALRDPEFHARVAKFYGSHGR